RLPARVLPELSRLSEILPALGLGALPQPQGGQQPAGGVRAVTASFVIPGRASASREGRGIQLSLPQLSGEKLDSRVRGNDMILRGMTVPAATIPSVSFPASFASADAKRGKGIQLSFRQFSGEKLDSRVRGNDMILRGMTVP